MMANIAIWRCGDVAMWRCADADVAMWRYADADVAMWRYADVAMWTRLTAIALVLAATPAFAQLAPGATGAAIAPREPLLRSVPESQTPGPPIALTLPDAVKRGLDHNLAVLLQEQQVKSAAGTRWERLSGLLPDVQAIVRESQQKVNLAAFGFTGFPGVPKIIGPFEVFDARVAVSQPLFDLGAIHEARQGHAIVRAAEHTLQDARNLVAVVVANLYLQAIAAESRVEAAQSELTAAESLYQLAVDQKTAGLVAGLEVLRADVERKAAAQRRIAAANALERARLQLSRAIGLPAAQQFSLSDRMPYAPLPEIAVDAAVTRAMSTREDVQTAEARLEAASESLSAARGERLPSAYVQADYGQIGSAPADVAGTYAVSGNVRIPMFDKGHTRARILEREAEVNQRRAELADLKNGVAFEVQLALADVTAAAQQVEVARSASDLAAQALTQAQDRFRAGVASNIEVVQAQQAEAAAHESLIASLYAHNVAKAALARALGIGEQEFTGFLGGQAPPAR